MTGLSLFAVHISSGVLANGWIIGGFIGLAILLLPAFWKLTEDDIPRIGVFTAAFFIASSLRIPLGFASVHLVLNGLIGVTLGRRAMLAVAVGLAMHPEADRVAGLRTRIPARQRRGRRLRRAQLPRATPRREG